MIVIGYPPYLECSSRGDKRFSAFYARIVRRRNQSIEEIYQAAKVFPNGDTGLSWREAKGRVPVNCIDVQKLYALLWDEYIEEKPQLIPILINATGLSDMFGRHNHACQAVELWRIRNKHILHTDYDCQVP